jgi:glycosyltransferase involved in cell wall biosynthesis
MESLLAQSFREFELIVVNDGSCDETEAILTGYAARDLRIIVLRNDTPRGLAASLNRALALVRAPLVARADGDDLYHPDRFVRQVAYMHGHPEIGVLSCGFRRIDSEGKVISTVLPTTGTDQIRFQMHFMNALLHPGVVFRAELGRTVGGYDERYWTAQDSDLWARLLPRTKMENLPEPLVDYRIHNASIMKTRGQAGRRLSLSVPARLLGTYLGRSLTPEDVQPAVDLYGGFARMNPDAALEGAALLTEVCRAAGRREPGPVRRAFRKRVARSLIQHAKTAPTRERIVLVARALVWWSGPTTMKDLSVPLLRRAKAVLLPRP